MPDVRGMDNGSAYPTEILETFSFEIAMVPSQIVRSSSSHSVIATIQVRSFCAARQVRRAKNGWMRKSDRMG